MKQVGLLFIIGLALEILTACSEPTPTSTPVATPSAPQFATPFANTAPPTKFVYPPEAINQYNDVCTKTGQKLESCRCFITKAQNVYPLEQLVSINNDVVSGKVKQPKEITQLLKDCEPVDKTRLKGGATCVKVFNNVMQPEATASFDQSMETIFIDLSSKYQNFSKDEFFKVSDKMAAGMFSHCDDSLFKKIKISNGVYSYLNVK